MRQRYRDEVLATGKDSFGELRNRLQKADFRAAVFASQEALDTANAARKADEQLKVVRSL